MIIRIVCLWSFFSISIYAQDFYSRLNISDTRAANQTVMLTADGTIIYLQTSYKGRRDAYHVIEADNLFSNPNQNIATAYEFIEQLSDIIIRTHTDKPIVIIPPSVAFSAEMAFLTATYTKNPYVAETISELEKDKSVRLLEALKITLAAIAEAFETTQRTFYIATKPLPRNWGVVPEQQATELLLEHLRSLIESSRTANFVDEKKVNPNNPLAEVIQAFKDIGLERMLLSQLERLRAGDKEASIYDLLVKFFVEIPTSFDQIPENNVRRLVGDLKEFKTWTAQDQRHFLELRAFGTSVDAAKNLLKK